ncbi:MAG: hypothetical protein JJU27_07370 [Gammaproteobacteria bacterium]|nr:hypothetical protein [Gammaproteobacteria bacterium]
MWLITRNMLTTVAGIALLGGCAATDTQTNADEASESRSISTDWVRIDQVRDFRVLDDSNLILYAPTRRQAYHVELMPACQGLRFADTIALRGRTGRLAGFAGDRVIIDRPGVPDRCPVASVRRLDEASLTELIVSFEGEPDGDAAADEAEVEIPRRNPDDDIAHED